MHTGDTATNTLFSILIALCKELTEPTDVKRLVQDVNISYETMVPKNQLSDLGQLLL